ncbi:uncharacterized protein LOC6547215 [Drosophila erecta]|uniref:Uncharacterized protein n=1 Tax=Drosophila erecta TaxID=7220 RepID=B3NK91_DROER|nr:uncharacterized protein LOC6547215 [Drosophila erecta]EDV55113.1 uncharacterized protein Dere_GG21914 [Drosophila erecta]
MTLWWIQGLLILCTVSVGSRKSNFEVRFESIEPVEGDTKTLFIYQLRLLGRDRKINRSLIFLEDLDETFDILLESHAFKNGNWVKGIVNVASKPCDFFNRYYLSYFRILSTDSNLPTTRAEICPFRKGTYFVKDGVVSTDDWPPIVFKGLNKYTISYLKDGERTGGVEFTISILEIIP